MVATTNNYTEDERWTMFRLKELFERADTDTDTDTQTRLGHEKESKQMTNSPKVCNAKCIHTNTKENSIYVCVHWAATITS